MKIIRENKKIKYDYDILKYYKAGIELLGSEVKSIKNLKVDIKNSYLYFKENEIFINGLYIGEYEESGDKQNHEPYRVRKILLTREELNKLFDKSFIKGLSIVPISIFIDDNGLIKLKIALVKGKKKYDKKEKIKERDIKRNIEKENKLKIK